MNISPKENTFRSEIKTYGFSASSQHISAEFPITAKAYTECLDPRRQHDVISEAF